MKDLEKIKWEHREWERENLAERWRKEDEWKDEAKRESEYQRFLYEKNLKKW